MVTPDRTEAGRNPFPRAAGAGVDYVISPGDAEDNFGLKVEGDAYPRILLDPLTSEIRVGDGTVPPVAIVGSTIGLPTPVVTLVPVVFAKDGKLVQGAGVEKFPVRGACTIVEVDANLGTATGTQSAIWDVNKNGTTIFTNQSHRPLIGPGGFAVQVEAPNIDIQQLNDGDILTVDSDQIGAVGAEGLDAVITIWLAYVSQGAVSPGAYALPPGGTDGQFLRKLTATDGVAQWVTVTPGGGSGVPGGGTTGQVLTKASNADGDVGWVTPTSPPAPTGVSTVVFARDWTLGDTWGSWTEYPITDGTVTHSRSVVNDTSDFAGTTLGKVGRVSWSSGTNGNDRRIIVPDGLATIADLEMRTEFRARNVVSSASPQFGHAHRAVNLGDTTNQNMFMVWVDSTFNADDTLNVGVWKGITPGGTFTHPDDVTLTLESLDHLYHVSRTMRVGNVVSYEIDGGHTVRVGDVVEQDLTTSSFEVAGVVTAVVGNVVSVAQTGADVAWAANPGIMRNRSQCLPYVICSRAVGSIFEAKAWRSDDPEPSWSDSNAVLRLVSANAPTGVGAHGLLVAHLNASGEYYDVGPTTWRTPGDRP